jgi:type II secretory pathway pseudopilin PulG
MFRSGAKRTLHTSEEGFTLIDSLVAVTLLGLGVTILLQSWGDSISLSLRGRHETTAAALVASAGDAVIDPIRNPYAQCATPASYNASKGVGTAPKYAITIDAVRYWNGSSFGAVCYDTTATYGPLAQMQEITVSVVSAGPSGPDGFAKRTVVVVKRSSL